MIKPYKYDVAISVAEENKDVAKLIARALEALHIRHYYYEDNAAVNWGKYIINLTADAYGRRARYVLMITSKYYVKKYWSGIERQMALATPRPGDIHILQLRLDDTPIDGLSKYVVFQEWKDNPVEIAKLLKQKIRDQKRKGLYRNAGYSFLVASIMSAIALTYLIASPPPRHTSKYSKPKSFQKVLIAGQTKDTFYIGNTEVTVAQYRDYCNSQLKPMPAQPPLFNDNGPVVNVTWDEAQQFCKWKGGRLPTTTEWQLAASCGLRVKYSGGNNAQQVAVYNRVKPCMTGTKAANSYGLYDMSGNVAEWCYDWADSSFQYKVVKGGAYNSTVYELTISCQAKVKPLDRQPYIGFRVTWDK